jgi:hypothetical protein
VLQQLHSSSTGDNVREYPAHYQKLLARILIGIMESKPWVEAAFPKKEFEELSDLRLLHHVMNGIVLQPHLGLMIA